MSLARQFGIATGNPGKVATAKPVTVTGVTPKGATPTANVTRDVTPNKTREVRYVDQAEFDALKADIAECRALIAKLSVASTPPSTKSRAAYMREYRKGRKSQP